MAISPTSSAAAASAGTSFNVDGVISGLNTASIITQLMKLSQAPLDQLTAQQTAVKARDAAYHAISSQLITFQASAQNLLLSTAINAKTSASTTPTVATATADSTAINGNFSVTSLNLATATSVISNGTLGSQANLASGAVLAGAGATVGMAIPPTAGSFTINGQKITLVNGESWTTLQNAISNLQGPAVTLNVIPGSNSVSLTSASPLQLGSPTDTSNFLSATQLLGAAQTGAAGGYTVASRQLIGEAQPGNSLASAGLNTMLTSTGGSFSVNGVSINWTNTDSISNILTRINSSAAGVTATYDPKLDKVSLTNSNTGAQSISLVDGPGSNLLQALHLKAGASLGSTPDLNSTSSAVGAAGFLITPTAGTFTVNGTQVTVTAGETWSALQTDISTKTGGVVTLTLGPTSASLSSAAPIQLGAAADTSNLLQALSLTDATQVAGAAAQYQINQNGVLSAIRYSNSNLITNAVQGVNVTLVSGAGATTSISTTQDTATATTNIQAFITQFNSMVDSLDAATAITTTGTVGVLAGDSTITGLANKLRSIVSQAAVVPAGSAYTTMGDIGISTGAFGSAVGTTNHLVLDTGKLTSALQNNPQAVTQLLSGLSGTTSLGGDASSTALIQSATGSPYGQVYSGSYKVTFDPSTLTLKSVFTSINGTISPAMNGTFTAGGTNTSLIPGVSLVFQNPLPGSAGVATIDYTVSGRGIFQTLNDYVNQSRGPTGVFVSESTVASSTQASLTAQIANQNVILSQRRATLQAQFTAMEVALASLQSQGAALSSSLGVANTTAAANSASSSSSG